MAADAQIRRVRNLQRLVRLQDQLRKRAEADLAQATRDRDAVVTAINDLLDAMGGLSETHRLFPHLYAGQLGRLKTREQVLNGQIERHRARIDTERKRGEKVGEQLDQANVDIDRHVQDEGLFDLLDQVGKPQRWPE